MPEFFLILFENVDNEISLFYTTIFESLNDAKVKLMELHLKHLNNENIVKRYKYDILNMSLNNTLNRTRMFIKKYFISS